MKAIIIKDDNRDKINTVIATAEGYARERKINYDYIAARITAIEKHVDISRNAMNGSTATICTESGGYRYPGKAARKYVKESSIATIECKNGKWYLVDVCRGYTPNYSCTMEYSETAKDAIVKKYACIY